MNDRAAAWFEASLHHRLWFDEHDAHDGASLPFGLCRRGDLTVVRKCRAGRSTAVRFACSTST